MNKEVTKLLLERLLDNKSVTMHTKITRNSYIIGYILVLISVSYLLSPFGFVVSPILYLSIWFRIKDINALD